jgi:zinc/manganese transport system substrate-binding protein
MFKRLIVSLGLVAAALPAHAALSVFACEPEWGALVREIGGERVDVYNATNALQDPHHVQARPALIAHLRRADLAVCTGAELEVGWLPVLQRKAGNARMQAGSRRLLFAAEQVQRLEMPQRVTRAEGDVHASGNPHINTDPRRIAQVATAVEQRLVEIDPAGAAEYRRRYQDFEKRWAAATQRWEKEGAALKGKGWVVYHDQWVYLEDWLGIRRLGELEPKPGLPPTPSHLAELTAALRAHPPAMIVRAASMDPSPAQWLSGKLDVPVVELPFTVGGTDGADDLFGLFDVTLKRLTGALQ